MAFFDAAHIPPIDEVIKAGAVPYFVLFLEKTDHPQLQVCINRVMIGKHSFVCYQYESYLSTGWLIGRTKMQHQFQTLLACVEGNESVRLLYVNHAHARACHTLACLAMNTCPPSLLVYDINYSCFSL